MLDGWHEFYTVLGTGAAALIALLFVAVSVGADALTPERTSATRTFMSPVVFHYTNILFLSLIALIPTQTPVIFGLIIGIASAGSFVYSTVIFVMLCRTSMADLADRLAYGVVPFGAYASGMVSSYLLLTGSVATGLEVLAGAALLLLVVNIRNAWDLMLAMARHNAQRTSGQPPPTTPT
jgi:hypothetical protein